jgi:hypothetical protein
MTITVKTQKAKFHYEILFPDTLIWRDNEGNNLATLRILTLNKDSLITSAPEFDKKHKKTGKTIISKYIH